MRMKIRLPLKVKDQVEQVRVKLVDDLVIQVRRYISSGAGKLSEAGRAFGASQVA
jgi:hypothetical protein